MGGRRTPFPWVLCLAFLSLAAAARAQEGFSGRAGVEAGFFQDPGGVLRPYQWSSLFLEDRETLLPSLSLGLAGEAGWQASPVPLAPSWPLYFQSNYLKLEDDRPGAAGGSTLLRLDRAFLHWVSGPLEVKAGLFKPGWGSAKVYRPTDYFNPLPPLAWQRDESLGSEGLDAGCFLFDDLSLEGAVRWLEGGDAEGVVRLVNKGIGITFTPSLAWMNGRNGLGLEVSGTFPSFQVRFEGVDWLYAGGRRAADWVAGVSTVHEGFQYTAEVMGDNRGDILGGYSSRSPAAAYVCLSAQGGIGGNWRMSPSLITPLGGGPFLFWPELSWAFSDGWTLAFQAQTLLGNWPGPLALLPGRGGVSVERSF